MLEVPREKLPRARCGHVFECAVPRFSFAVACGKIRSVNVAIQLQRVHPGSGLLLARPHPHSGSVLFTWEEPGEISILEPIARTKALFASAAPIILSDALRLECDDV